MSQPTLQMEPAVIEAEIVEPTQNHALIEIREQMLAVPVEKLKQGMAQYDDWRAAFRKWLLSHMTPGVHYGVPPGCEPKRDERGWIGVFNKNADNGRGGKGAYVFYPPEQWQAKPSLYKAGANLIIDLMQLVDVYESDGVAWEMMGKPAGTVVRTCRLYPKGKSQNAETLRGHGTGARVMGQKGGDANNCIKMADKNALVAAVINGFALADLFTQDLEDGQGQKEPGEKPTKDPKAPKVRPRTDRVTNEEFDAFKIAFKRYREARKMPSDKSAFETWVAEVVRMSPENATHPSAWMRDDFEKCKAELEDTHE